MRTQPGDAGFTLIEMTVASTIFVVLAVAFASTMASAIGAYQTARARTVAQQLGMQQIEESRRLEYDDLGTALGNPPGVIEPTRTVELDGTRFIVRTSIAYVDDPLPGGFQTSANYKLVSVSVTSSATGDDLLATMQTKVAPPTQPSLSKAVVELQVVDDFNRPVPDATVRLANGPSADRSATTEEDGWVLFAGLTPNPTTGPGSVYDVEIDAAGLAVHPDDAAKTRLQLSPSQRLRTGIRVIHPVAATVMLVDATSAPFTAPASVVVSWDAGQQRRVVPMMNGVGTITELDGTTLAPNRQYTMSAYAPGGYFSAAVSAVVPDGYPDDLDTAFTLQLTPFTTANLQVRVREAGTLRRINGATVVIEGGPASVLTGGTTPTGANLVTALPVSGTSYTVRVIATGYSSAQSTVTLPAGGTTATFNLSKAPG